MTFNEKKQLLEQIKRQKYYAQRKQDSLKELLLDYQCLTAKYSGLSSKTNTISNPVLRTVEKIEKAQEEYAKEYEKFFEQYENVKTALLFLPITERYILEDIYIRGKSVIYLTTKYSYSERAIYKIRDRGINNLKI